MAFTTTLKEFQGGKILKMLNVVSQAEITNAQLPMNILKAKIRAT